MSRYIAVRYDLHTLFLHSFPLEHGMWRVHISLSPGEVSNLCAEQRGAQLPHILPDVRRRARRPAPETQTDGAGSVQRKFIHPSHSNRRLHSTHV